MAKQPSKKPEKQLDRQLDRQPDLPPTPASPPTTKVLPMQLQVGDRMTDSTGDWEVIGRPYTTAGGKTAHVRVQ